MAVLHTRVTLSCLLSYSCGITVFLAASALPVSAAEPYVTDDARIVERGACQLEAGSRGQPAGHERWLLPACNLGLNTEVTLGRVATTSDGARDVSNVVQLKALWREMETHGYGLGWIVRSDFRRHPASAQRRSHEHSAALLASRSLLPEKLIVHANLGGRWNRDDHQGAATAGVLGELQVFSHLAFLAELYGASHTRRGYQFGVRLTLVPDHIELNISRGGDASDGNGKRYWAVGVQLVTSTLTP